MRLAISNLAWPQELDQDVASLLNRLGVRGVELAPTKIWPRPLEVCDADVRKYRAFWEDRGIQIVAFQALLFGRPELTIFEDPDRRRQTLDYLAAIARLAGQLGTQVLVFGSPRNRLVKGLRPVEAAAIAEDFFRNAGARARAQGAMICIEPNPVEYQCDFITRTHEGGELVRKVNEPGFGLHLDAGGMTLSDDQPATAFAEHCSWIRHFHISEPYLAPIGKGKVDHAAMAAALRNASYDGWVSIEMKQVEDRPNLEELERVLRFALRHYG